MDRIHAHGMTNLETALRFFMFAMAAATAFTGFTFLTTPLAIPFTIGMWMGAAAMVGLGVWGRLPPEREPSDGLQF